MRVLLLLPILLVWTPNILALELGFHSGFDDETSSGLSELFALERSADQQIRYDARGNCRFRNTHRNGDTEFVSATMDQLEGILGASKSMTLAVVRIDKLLTWKKEEDLSEHVDNLTNALRKIGYQRVVVLASHGMGAIYLGDTSHQEPTTEQAIR